jgi:hypothetical protein
VLHETESQRRLLHCPSMATESSNDIAGFCIEMSGLPVPGHPDFDHTSKYALITVDALDYGFPPNGGHCIMVRPEPGRHAWESMFIIQGVADGRDHDASHPCRVCIETIDELNAQRFVAWVMDVV